MPPAPTVVVYGCGNVLLGDDGFGPAVIERLLVSDLPATVRAIDAGTSIREHLLDYLMLPALRPELLVIVDMEFELGAMPGRVRLCGPDAIPVGKRHDVSLHQFPTVNLLRELQEETGIEVMVLLGQAAFLPQMVAPGLSPPVQFAVDVACDRIRQLITVHVKPEVLMP